MSYLFKILKDLPANFEGILSVKAWDETEIVSWRYTGSGRSSTKVGLLPKPRNTITNLAAVPCPPFWGLLESHSYCIFAGEASDDEPNPCDYPRNWVTEETWGWILPEGPCDDGSGSGSGDPCNGMTPEQCACLTYGLGCDDGGRGDGGAVDDVIDKIISDTCLNKSLNLIEDSTGGLKGALIGWANTTFGTSTLFNLSIQDGLNLPPEVFAQWTSNFNGGTFNGQVLLDNNKLQGASMEFQVYAMLHELYHGYLEVSGKAQLVSNDHNLFVAYREHMIKQLQLCFPNLSYDDASCLSWGGLQQYTDRNGIVTTTIGWGAINQQEKSRILNVISSFQNKSKAVFNS